MKIKVGITIDASPEAVWAAVEQIERHVDWMTDAVSITFTTPSHRGVGTAFNCLTKVGPLRTVDRMVVTEWKPGEAMGIEHRGFVVGRGRFELKRKHGNRTKFTWSEELRFPWWMGGAVGAFVAKPVLRRIWKRNLAGLAALVASGR